MTLQRRAPIRSRSAKRARLYREQRIPIVRALLDARPVCERCHAAASTDVHEIKSRARGGSITDPDNLCALCRSCHEWVTTHPTDAQQQGWLAPSWG